MEDLEMFARKTVFSSFGCGAVIATVAAMALTVAEPSLARAGSASGATDISARHRGYGGGAAAAAAFAGIVGTGLAIAATRRAYYDDYDGGPAYYGGGPVYYGGGPVYYGGGPGYYGPGYGYGRSRSEFGGQPNGHW
jgi:hypothetical protein